LSAAALETGMNWSLYTADRATHIRVIVVGLTAALLIAVIGVSAAAINIRADVLTAQGPTVIKAGGPVAITEKSGPIIR
jgi:hypothetical protein